MGRHRRQRTSKEVLFLETSRANKDKLRAVKSPDGLPAHVACLFRLGAQLQVVGGEGIGKEAAQVAPAGHELHLGRLCNQHRPFSENDALYMGHVHGISFTPRAGRHALGLYVRTILGPGTTTPIEVFRK